MKTLDNPEVYREREGRELHPLPLSDYQQPGSHIKLKKGVVKFNPHLQVLCPTLAAGLICRKGFKNYRGVYHRPKFLLKNHGDPNLQLWSCKGCEDKFLLRVELESTRRINFE